MKKIVFIIDAHIKNYIQTYNNQLKNAYKSISKEDTQNTYLILLNEDLMRKLKNKDQFIDDYIALAEEFDLPYTFFPYYGNFNKVMIQISPGIPHPIFEITLEKRNNKVINITHQIAPGCLVLNVNKLKSINFKFDQNYSAIFYLQDLVEKCYRAKLWISNCWYIDRLHSWEDVEGLDLTQSHPINPKTFQAEQKKYFETNKDLKFKEAQPFIDDLKKWLNGEEVTVEINQPPLNVNLSDINIAIPQNLINNDKVLNINSLSTIAVEENNNQENKVE